MMAATRALARPFPFGPVRLRRRWMSLPATATDAELVAFARRGEGDGVARLVERYSARLYRYLLHLTSNPAAAEELLQDTWLRVVERLDGYDARQPFLTWLFAIARHRAIDLMRARARETRALGQPAAAAENDEGERLEPLDTVAAAGPSPLDELAARELEERVARLFARLPRHYREALTLRFHHDFSLEEIARLLDVPLSTVKTRVQRGLVLLRRRAESSGLNE
jgi:RNA polymerase sigma-70 factor (ECF subfamily)